MSVLADSYDVALLDLDGVVYVGPAAVPGVPEALVLVRTAGMRLGFVTNNAARPPAAVAEHLGELGIVASDDDVVTSRPGRCPAGRPSVRSGRQGACRRRPRRLGRPHGGGSVR